MANEAEIEWWDGAGGEQWVKHAEIYDRLLAPFNDQILDRAAPGPGERVLEIGCGNGALTVDVARQVAPGEVVAVDISGPMLSFAARRAAEAELANVRFEKGDAQTHALSDGESSFDVAVSRFGVMFFDDPPAAFSNIARFVKPEGRLTFTCWRDRFANEWLTVPAAAILQHVPFPDMGPPDQPGPFAFADAGRCEEILTSAGFRDVNLIEVDASLLVGTSLDDALSYFRQTELAAALLADADEETKERAWASVAEALEPRATAEGVRLGGAAWLVTARKSS